MAGRPPFDQFSSEEEDIDSYLERLQEYFIAYDIKDGTEHAAKRRAILLTSIGSVSYRVLKDLSFPDAPNTKTCGKLRKDTDFILLTNVLGSQSQILSES